MTGNESKPRMQFDYGACMREFESTLYNPYLQDPEIQDLQLDEHQLQPHQEHHHNAQAQQHGGDEEFMRALGFF